MRLSHGRWIDRRRFVQLAAAALAGTMDRRGLARGEHARRVRLGCAAGAIKHSLRTDWLGTLREVAAIGYKELEFSDPFGPSDEECRKALDDLGIKSVAGGTGLIQLEQTLPRWIEHSHALGKEFVACYWPWRDDGHNKTLEDYRLLADHFNYIGQRLHAEGLRFVFHHHDLEFQRIEGVVPCDFLLRNTDPAIVAMELDVFWAALAGVDAAHYFNEHKDRIALLHLGDKSKTAERTVACLGEGSLDIRAVLDSAARLPGLHIMIENPDATTGVACLATGYRKVRELGF